MKDFMSLVLQIAFNNLYFDKHNPPANDLFKSFFENKEAAETYLNMPHNS